MFDAKSLLKTIFTMGIITVIFFILLMFIGDLLIKSPDMYGYIDLQGNEGRAYSCTQVRSGFQCYSEKGSMVQVMEYWEIYE